MSTTSKVVSFEAAPQVFQALRQQGKKIVQSHGIFDLTHPGHICHLEEARSLGDVRVDLRLIPSCPPDDVEQ